MFTFIFSLNYMRQRYNQLNFSLRKCTIFFYFCMGLVTNRSVGRGANANNNLCALRHFLNADLEKYIKQAGAELC